MHVVLENVSHVSVSLLFAPPHVYSDLNLTSLSTKHQNICLCLPKFPTLRVFNLGPLLSGQHIRALSAYMNIFILSASSMVKLWLSLDILKVIS